jgi:hypothetical protein
MRTSVNFPGAYELSPRTTTARQSSGSKRVAPRIVSHTLAPTPAPVADPGYGCVEWYIYEERRGRRDGN